MILIRFFKRGFVDPILLVVGAILVLYVLSFSGIGPTGFAPGGQSGRGCGNGIDDDNDGLIDYPNDPGCTSRKDRTETDPNLICDDGLDATHDADTLADFRVSGGDPGCAYSQDAIETDGDCDDLIDNDADTHVDFGNNGDSECLSFSSNSEDPRDYCSDSDNGIDESTLGTVTGEDASVTFSYTDSCADANNLNEYYCGDKPEGYDPLYQIIVCANGCSNGVCQGSQPPPTGCDNDNICESGQGEDCSSCSNDCGACPPTPPPSSSIVVGVTSSTVSLDWPDVAGATGYNVYIAPELEALGVDADRKLVASGLTISQYTIINLAADIDVFVRVEALGATVPSGDKFLDDHAKTIGGPRKILDNDLREVHSYAPNIIQVVIRNLGVISDGSSVTGHTGQAWQTATWTVKRNDGTNIPVVDVYRHSIPVNQPKYGNRPSNTGDRNDKIIDVDHRLYLVLGGNVLPNPSTDHADILYIQATNAPSSLTFNLPFSDRYITTTSTQLNQVAFNPRAREAWAYISGWMGADKSGVIKSLSLSNFPTTANVLTIPNDEMQGRSFSLQNIPITDRIVNNQYNDLTVKQIDLKSLPAADYVFYGVHVPGVGVSRPTQKSEIGFYKSYYTTLRGIFHNRWFGNLKKPYTLWERPIEDWDPNTPGIQNDYGVQDHGEDWLAEGTHCSGVPKEYCWSQHFPDPVCGNGVCNGYADAFYCPSECPDIPPLQKIDEEGGEHDAGDFDKRPEHITFPIQMLGVYEYNKQAFTDGQLDIPESGNGIPDLLDEILWNVAGWEALQDADGGVRLGVESFQHPPQYFYANNDVKDKKPVPYFTYSKNQHISAISAGAFAQAAYNVKPFNPTKANELQQKAVNAYNYARSNGATIYVKLYGASELWRLTGEDSYRTDFESYWDQGAWNYPTCCAVYNTADQLVKGVFAFPEYLQAYISMPGARSDIISKVRTDLASIANDRIKRVDNNWPHRISWRTLKTVDYGQGYGNYLGDLVNHMRADPALTATQKQDYIDAMSMQADAILGGNPTHDGLSLVTGLGSVWPRQPLHHDSLAAIKDNLVKVPGETEGRPLYGIPVWAIVENLPGDSYYQRAGKVYYPSFNSQPLYWRYGDVREFVRMSEFSFATSQKGYSALFATLVASGLTTPECWKPLGSEHLNTLPSSCDNLPPPTPECSDLIDNDNDNKIDYPADPGCSSASDNDETDPIPPPTGGSSTEPNLKVAFIADSNIGTNAKAVLQLIKEDNYLLNSKGTAGTDMVIHAGDMGYGDESNARAQEWENQLNSVLGNIYPYFYTKGNHDVTGWSTYKQNLQARIDRINAQNSGAIQCTGALGEKSSCKYKGLFFLLTSPGEGFSGDGDIAPYIKSELANEGSTWSVCSWHKNQREMQIGGKSSETGWGVYEECRKGGAVIDTAHEHSYERTKTLIDTDAQTVDPQWPDPNNVRVNEDDTSTTSVDEGATFVFVSGIGGSSIRNQQRCLPTTYPYGCNGEWAKIYATDQGANYGALFIVFNVDGNPNKAKGYLKNINGQIVEEFVINSEVGGPSQPPVYECSDGKDNDGDGKIDYPLDPGCSSSSDNDETDPIPPPTTKKAFS